MAKNFTTKQVLIDKANSTILIAVCAGISMVIVTLFLGRALLERHSYQLKVMGKKRDTLKILEDNEGEIDKLKKSISDLDSTALIPPNENPNNLTGSQIVLNALPSKYDFPAVASSMGQLARRTQADPKKYTLSGKDEGGKEESSPSPSPVVIPLELKMINSQDKVQQWLLDMERSIRPIKVSKLDISLESGELEYGVTGETYYQPTKKVTTSEEEVR